MTEGYVTVNDIREIVCKTELDGTNIMVPTLFKTHEGAWKDIADTLVTTLQQFIDGERELEHTDFATDEHVGFARIDYGEDITITVYYVDENGVPDFNHVEFVTNIKEMN